MSRSWFSSKSRVSPSESATASASSSAESAYTDKQLMGDIEWLFAGHDQGQRDDIRKSRASNALLAADDRAVRVLTACVRRILEIGTIEDVASFLKFLDWYLGYSL